MLFFNHNPDNYQDYGLKKLQILDLNALFIFRFFEGSRSKAGYLFELIAQVSHITVI
jgi:hypothetical protein